jgi:triosephosphate isomerase (TIM)
MNYVIGNWKSNKTVEEARKWLNNFSKLYRPHDNTQVILCVSYIHVPLMRGVPFSLGVQDISPFDQGAYTGEIAVSQLDGLVEYCLVGHSERRKYFNEDDKLLEAKIKQAKESGIEPIFCVQSADISIPSQVEIVAYEPVDAIGTGKPADPVECCNIIKKIKRERSNVKTGIYGGSVNSENIATFFSQSDIDGVLPGGASLDAEEFAKIIENASKN